MEEIKLSRVGPADVLLVQQIARETFTETFSGSNTEADMVSYLEQNLSSVKLKAELSNPDSAFYLAWSGKCSVGYLKVNWGAAQTEVLGDQSLEIERIYVAGSHQRKNVGQLLYEKALAIAREQNKSFIWLGVWEQNSKAIRFYERNGFVPFDKHVFKMGSNEQIDIMMKKELSSSALQEVVELEERLISAITESNLPVLDELLDDGLIFTNHMGISLSKQDDLAPHRSGDLKINNIRVSDQQVKLHGDTTVVVVSKLIQGAYMGSGFEIYVRFTRVWKLKNAQWKVIAVSSVPMPV